MSYLKTMVHTVIGCATAAVVLVGVPYLFGDRYVLPPDHAAMVINETRHIYISPPCYEGFVMEDFPLRDKIQTVTMKDVRQRREKGEAWRPDDVCNRADGYWQKDTFWQRVFGQERIRWTSAGKWRW